ncbi:MAG: HPr family phosphocarrier protein [Planctomycetota bacterium]
MRVTVQNRLGLHARPAMALVDTVKSFDATVRIRRDDVEVDASSIMEVMMLAATQGTELEVRCHGTDARGCALAIRELVNARFGED